MTVEEAKKKIEETERKLSAYSHASALIYYDGCTAAPKDTAANRGQALSVLSEEQYKLSTGMETVDTLEFLDAHKDELDQTWQRRIFLELKEIRQMQKIPMEEYVALQELLVQADDVWHKAKADNNFPLFEPVLEKVFEAYKKIAGYCAPEKKPYDYWLNEYEDGLDMARADEFFSTLRERIVPLLKKVQSVPQVSDACLRGDFPQNQQEKLSEYLMKVMGIDFGHCGITTTEHPFTINFGSHFDVRITTHYKEDNFASSMYSVIHEGGHALYEMGVDDAYAYTSLDGGVSMGIHESQSRFYENLIGRSKAFTGLVFPKLCELFPEQMKGHTAEEFYKAVNRAQPSLIRTEADELTYCLHIMVRYEIEKRIFAGELAIHDLPAEWNKLYKEYLGIDVPDDRRGVLQDSHWSGGNIGYFPSYALGSAYGAQLLKKMKETVDVDSCIERGDLEPINEWNREHVWKFGCLYKPLELLEKATGEKFDPKIYTDYLEHKFSAVYGV